MGIGQTVTQAQDLVSKLQKGLQDRANNALLWAGPSPHDGSSIAVVASGFNDPSRNKKTGPMVQISIISAVELPTESYTAGRDTGVCGNCSLRSKASGGNGGCYVTVFHAPNAKGKALRGGKFWDVRSNQELKRFLALLSICGAKVRFGEYGDPSMIPWDLVEKIARAAKGSTGYSHQWKEGWFNDEMFNFMMASCDSLEEAKTLHSRGVRTTRLSTDGSDLLPNETICPNYTHGVQCADCLLCDGTRADDKRRSIVFPVHGGSKKSLIKVLQVVNA